MSASSAASAVQIADADDLRSQGVEVVSVDWKPPAGGDVEMMRLLEKLGA